MLGLAALMAVGCSLRSLDDLKRCDGKAESAECPSPGSAGVGAQGGAGVGNTGAGGSAAEGGSAAAGSGGSSGGPAAGGAAGAQSEPELILLYAYRSQEDPEPITESKNVRPIFAIRNDSELPVDISELSIRYYFTLEAPAPLLFECDYVNTKSVVNDCEGVIGTFGMLPEGDEAKNYLELTFAPPDGETWAIPELGSESGPIQVRFWKDDFSAQDQETDYSFDATKVDDPEPWDHVTLYRDGLLVWGIEPI